MRLIDADELLKNAYKSGDWDRGEHPMVVDVEDIEGAPTVDLWHYPSKGEVPPFDKHLSDENEVLLYFRNKSKAIGWYIKTKDREGWLTDYGWEPLDKVLAWQYIISPKEEV